MTTEAKGAASLPILKGRVYRAKKPANAEGFFNDRLVLWTNGVVVQYDGPAVGFGRRFPKVTVERFAAWAARDVTDELPKDEWARYARQQRDTTGAKTP